MVSQAFNSAGAEEFTPHSRVICDHKAHLYLLGGLCQDPSRKLKMPSKFASSFKSSKEPGVIDYACSLQTASGGTFVKALFQHPGAIYISKALLLCQHQSICSDNPFIPAAIALHSSSR